MHFARVMHIILWIDSDLIQQDIQTYNRDAYSLLLHRIAIPTAAGRGRGLTLLP